MVSISGIRGIVGQTMTPEVAVRYASAFGEYCAARATGRPCVVLGRDGRSGGALLAGLVSSTLLARGIDVLALDVAPTPTIAMAVEQTGAAGGVSVTASHNPVQWNGLKFFASGGLFLDAEANEELGQIAARNPGRYAPWDRLGLQRPDATWIGKHLETVLSLPYLDIDTLRRRRFKVALDCVNASGGTIMPSLLRSLGCSVVELHCDVSGVFAHTPEPVPENLTELRERVIREKADLGIAVDPDADRLVFITETGEPFGEEYTVAAAVRFVLERERALRPAVSHTVVVNLSTTRAVDDIARAYGAAVLRTPVGEMNVAQRMLRTGAVIGGEGSGGVILPSAHPGRDAMVGTGLILQMLAESPGSLGDLKRSLPAYSIVKAKIDRRSAPAGAVLAGLERVYAGQGTSNTDDGLKIDFADSWVHLRASNTEPIVRVIAEARTPEEARRLADRVLAEAASFT